MSCITAENANAWQELFNKLALTRPSVGKRVEIEKGKQAGRTGTVQRHQPSKFKSHLWRYGSEASDHFRDAAGREGFCCLVRTDDGATFWVAAEHTKILEVK